MLQSRAVDSVEQVYKRDVAVLVGEVEGGHRPVVNAELAGDELHGDGLVHTLAGHFGLDECVQLLRVMVDGLLVSIVAAG